MLGYPEAPRAWGYTRGMARVMGVSLPDAVMDGWLSRQELGVLVDACRSCGATCECSDWLAHAVTAPAAPTFCPNGSALAALKP